MGNDFCHSASPYGLPCVLTIVSFLLLDNSVIATGGALRAAKAQGAGKGPAGTQQMGVLAEEQHVQRPRGGRREKECSLWPGPRFSEG